MSAELTLADKTSVAILSEVDLENYGITLNYYNETLEASLTIYSDDKTLYDSFFEIEIQAKVLEEPEQNTWFNTTRIKINLFKPDCEVKQEEINAALQKSQPKVVL